MKLSTIWTMPACTLREKIQRTTKEWVPQKIAAALPKSVRYWAFIQSSVEAIDKMGPNTITPDVRVVDALQHVPGGRP